MYPVYLILHLLCAVTFGGAVIFEMLMLEPLHKRLPENIMRMVEREVVHRARHIMPWVVATLFISGGLLFYSHFPQLNDITASHFGLLLLLKVALALTVLACFITALVLFKLRRMTPQISHRIHSLVFVLIIGIMVLAKLMFYL